jgi:putative inorganic carbon (HCO3(-)) transporter
MSIANDTSMQGFYSLKLRAFLSHMKREHFSFWMICGYVFVEYVRPQSIIPSLAFLPWAQILLVLTLIGLMLDPKKSWVSDAANGWLTLFLLLILASSALAIYPQLSWPRIMDFFGWYLIYFLLINVVTNEKRFFIVLVIFCLASFKLSSFGARSWAMRGFTFTSWGIQGPPGYFMNSGELSIQMLMFAPIAFEAALFMRPHLTRFKFGVLMLLPVTAAMTVIGASSRGGQIALVYQFYRTLLKGRLTLKALVIVGILGAAFFALLPNEQKSRFEAVGSDRTSQQRLLYWKHGAEMIRDHPVLGVGYFNFARYYADHYPEDMLYSTAQLPHNIFVQVGTDTGVPGLFVFIMILFRNFRCAREIRNMWAAAGKPNSFHAAVARGLTVALWGFIIAGQFVTVTYYPFLWINLAFTVALRNISAKALLAEKIENAEKAEKAEKAALSAAVQRA